MLRWGLGFGGCWGVVGEGRSGDGLINALCVAGWVVAASSLDGVWDSFFSKFGLVCLREVSLEGIDLCVCVIVGAGMGWKGDFNG